MFTHLKGNEDSVFRYIKESDAHDLITHSSAEVIDMCNVPRRPSAVYINNYDHVGEHGEICYVVRCRCILLMKIHQSKQLYQTQNLPLEAESYKLYSKAGRSWVLHSCFQSIKINIQMKRNAVVERHGLQGRDCFHFSTEWVGQ